MAETEQTKVCPLCAETIKAAAKVCPYCRKSQRRWAFMTIYDVSGILALVVFVGGLFLLNAIFYRERDFGSDHDKVRVLNFRFDIAKDKTSTNVVVLGVVTNESDHSWAINHIEVRYLDSQGRLAGMDDGQLDSFTILPKSDHAFRLDLYSEKSVPAYPAYKLAVISAEDPRAPFNLFIGN